MMNLGVMGHLMLKKTRDKNVKKYGDKAFQKHWTKMSKKDREKLGEIAVRPKPTKFKETNLLDNCTKISNLKDDHPVKDYIKKRLIPTQYYEIIYLVNKFHNFANKVKPGIFKEKYEHPRLIIPFFDVTGELFAFQGRAFGKEQPKYITIKLDETKQKVYGLERVNFQKHVYIVEGPLDSLFLDNCIAVAGADVPSMDCDFTIIFDNEPRNRELLKQIEKEIQKGHKIVLWPDSMKHKDINDMIMAEYTKEQIQEIIDDNTFSGVAAQLRFAEWKKIDEGSMGKAIRRKESTLEL